MSPAQRGEHVCKKRVFQKNRVAIVKRPIHQEPERSFATPEFESKPQITRLVAPRPPHQTNYHSGEKSWFAKRRTGASVQHAFDSRRRRAHLILTGTVRRDGVALRA